jgi:hypothetical protein
MDQPLRRAISLMSDENVTGAEIRISPWGSISGRVLDEDGEPEPGALVTVFKEFFQSGIKTWDKSGAVSANDLGEYRAPNLPPGRYLVQAYTARPQPNTRYGARLENAEQRSYYQTYYPATVRQRDAAVIELGSGGEIRGIDIRLMRLARPASVHIAGKVVGLPPDSPVVVSVSLKAIDEVSFGSDSKLARPPDYAFDLVAPPGQYTILARIYAGGSEAYGSQALSLTGGISGIALALAPPPVITARLVAPQNAGQVKLQGVLIWIADPARHGVWERRSDTAGKFAIPNPLQPGVYGVSVDKPSLPEGLFVQKIVFGEHEIPEGEFEVSTSAALDIFLSEGAGRITGAVVDKEDHLCAASSVTLIPTDPKLRPEKAVPDESGAFTFRSLPPGKYTLFAWEEMYDDRWQDPEFRKRYEDRATPVTVGRAETQNVRIRVIAAQDIK